MPTLFRLFGFVLVSGTITIALLDSTFAFDGVIEVGAKGKQIVALVREAERDAGFSGAVLAGDNGKIIAAVAVGKNGKQPLDVTTLFEIASCTKTFTAMAVMKLVEEGKLQLDDPISKYLAGIPENCQAITVRHLLQHTSGIPRHNSEGSGKELAKVLPTFLAGGPQTIPGERHEYWNQGYALLSEVIARASKKSYVGYMSEAIFKPCKMTSSRFNGQRAPRDVRVALGTSTRGADRTALEHPYGDEYGFQYRGMGGLVTNLVDLWRWDRTLAAGKLLTKESVAEMTKPGPDGYALGWRVFEENGHTIHQHTGSVRGFLALIRRVPDTESCLFVLANSDANDPFDIVSAACSAALAGKDVKLNVREAIDSKLATALVGNYRDSEGRTLTVVLVQGVLAASVNWHGPVSSGNLFQGEGDELSWLVAGETNKIAVERDANGKVSALTITDLDSKPKFMRAD